MIIHSLVSLYIATLATIDIVDDDVAENMEFARVVITVLGVRTNGTTELILNIIDNDGKISLN